MTKLVKLDKYDNKLLYELDMNSSVSLSVLSSKIKKSKQFIIYRMKQLEKEGVITGYNAIIDMSKLGFFTFRIYFKFQRMTEEDETQFVNYVQKNLKQVWTITSMHGKWDYALFLGIRTISDFHKIWDELILNYKKNIKSSNVSLYAPIHNFNRKFFIDNPKESVERIYGVGGQEETDELDWKIIESYSENVRQSSLELSRKLNVSPDTIRARIKKLEKSRIIAGYKLGLNLEPLGFVSYRVDFQLVSTQRNKELFEFCRAHNSIYQVNKSIGGADFEIEVVVKDLNSLMELIDEIKTTFKDVINDADYFGFSTFHILKYVPD